MSKRQKKTLVRLGIGLVLFLFAVLFPAETIFGEAAGRYISVGLYMIPYLVIGGDVLWRAVRNISRGQVFDENFLMAVATIGAIFLQDYDEAVFVMLFYQVGEWFQGYAVGRSRNSIAELMDIRPDSANVERGGELVEVDPETVQAGDLIVVKPGERVPLDGMVLNGDSELDIAALTGESLPRVVSEGDEVLSGSVNLKGVLRIRVTKPYGESTVARILELVENAADKKAKAENFITRFARYYTPAVVSVAVLLAVLPPLLFGGVWGEWIERGLIFLVVSCPCALVISIPLSFFGGIGGASRYGVLVKGSNYLEMLAKADTIVFDKTGTLTNGSFTVTAVHPDKVSKEKLLEMAALAEAYSDHPVALSIKRAYGKEPELSRVGKPKESAGHGVNVTVDGRRVLAGNAACMEENGIAYRPCHMMGTTIHVAIDGEYEGHIVISDTVKPDAKEALSRLKALGVRRTVMLTGDREEVAAAVAEETGIDEYHAELLPEDKVQRVETLMEDENQDGQLVFVGDGINDAPVLARADVGIAMGAIGSDAAIEAADIVLMDDKPSGIAVAMRIARKTMSIVRENIVFALGVKAVVLLLAAAGIANMWLAVFADVGVAMLAILNAMRAMRIKE